MTTDSADREDSDVEVDKRYVGAGYGANMPVTIVRLDRDVL